MSDFDLDLDALCRQFEPAVWRRGQEDARAGAVLSCAEADGMRGWYTAKVGEARTHTVEFQLARTAVHGQCTCDARYDCRHLAAALHTLADPTLAKEVAARKAVLDWLSVAEADGALASPRILPRLPVPDLPEPSGREVRFVVGLEHDSARGWQVRVAPRVGPANDDGRIKPRTARLVVSSAQSVIPAGVAREDLDLWHALRTLSSRDGEALEAVPGAEALLRRFVATGRARWLQWKGPALHWTDAVKEGRAQWQPRPDGTQHLRLLATPAHLVALPLDTPIWVDPSTGACGSLHVTLSPQRLRALYVSTDIPIDVDPGEDVRARISALGLPPPLHGPVEQVEIPLTPTLHLPETHGPDGPALSFRYGDVTVPLRGGESDVCRWDGANLRVSPRDSDAEQEALAGWQDLGLPAPDPEGNVSLDADGWLTLLDVLPVLERRGWARTGSPPDALAPTDPTAWYVDIDDTPDGEGWFTFELGVDVEGPEGTRRVNLLPVLLEAIEAGRLQHDRIVVGASVTLRLDDGTLLRVPAEKVQRLLDGLVSMTNARGGPDLRLRASTYDAAWLAQLEVDRWRGNDALVTLGRTLVAGVGPDDATVADGFRGELRDYQKVGLAWLQLLQRTHCGGVLADDMGLGKTVQVLAHILGEREAGRLDRPALVVAPVSVLGTWAQQAALFTPSLRVGLAHGPDRALTVDRLECFDVVLTSYATLLRDEGLRGAPYHVVALDEAQAIKNPRAKISGATRTLRTRQRLALTGTPIENSLLELWSIFRFVAPGLLGSQAQFSRAYARPAERGADDAVAGLRRRVAPFLLRRTKDAVLEELPPKTEVVRTVVLSPRERELYEAVRRVVSDDVREALRKKGLGLSRIVVLEALLRLRQICCDARLAKRIEDPPESSSKLGELMALLEPLIAAGRRVLVFSQFTKMLDLIAAKLDASSQPYLMLTGRSRKRQDLVDRFQAKEVPLMLVSLKAGGTGLNLTAADTVVLYDPWWNPAVEQQAIDRTHRIGQERPVTVYRLVCEGSVEERILSLQDHKRALAQAVQPDAGRTAGRTGFSLSEDDVETLLAPLPQPVDESDPGIG
ncbi:MAG: DEAD/DEAH box helicase [bacterium]|nr:DEAD/DEAH box helicase [bacterium]